MPLKKFSFIIILSLFVTANSGMALTIIDGATQGFYNSALGTTLDFTNPYLSTYLFPGANSNPDDPTIDPVPFEPDLSAASGILGNWLSDPTNLNSNWSGLQAIPTNWAVNTESAIVYEIDAGPGGLADVIANFGIDNGIFVWLDGAFLSGELRPGGASLGEHTINIGSLSAGKHYLQILREDHGGATGYAVNVAGTPVPEPSTWVLLSIGGMGMIRLLRTRTRQS